MTRTLLPLLVKSGLDLTSQKIGFNLVGQASALMNAALISKPVNGVAIQSAEKCLGNDSARSTDSRPWIQAPISVLSEAPLQDTSSTCALAPSGPRPIAKIDPSITETALVQEIKLSVNIAGQDRDAIANQYRHDE